MNIEQILDSINNGEIKKHIKEQYEKELAYIGELEALGFARFRVDAAAEDAHVGEREAIEFTRSRADAAADMRIFGEREAIEFARSRADAAADMLAAETTRTMAAQRKQIIGLMAAIAYISALAFALGIILGRAL